MIHKPLFASIRPGSEKCPRCCFDLLNRFWTARQPFEETRDTLRFAVTVWSYSLGPEEARSSFETGVLRKLSLDPQSRSEIQMPLERKCRAVLESWTKAVYCT